MADLHVLFPHASERSVAASELRSEAPLLPPQQEPTAHAPSAWTTFRLGFRYALLSGSNLYGTMATAALLPLLDLLGLFKGCVVLALALPVFTTLLALNGSGRAERFWIGMGGPPAMRELGRVALDQLAIHGLALLGVLCASSETDRFVVAIMWFISQSLYGLAGLTRSLAGTVQGRMLALGSLTLLTVLMGVLPIMYTGWITLFEVAVAQGLALSTLALLARLMMSGRWSAASAERRFTSPAWLAAPVLSLVPLPFVAMEVPPIDITATPVSIAPSNGEQTALIGSPKDDFNWGSSRYLWWRNSDDTHWERLPARLDRAVEVHGHPTGAVVYVEAPRKAEASGSEHVLTGFITPDRATVECSMPPHVGWTWWDASGESLTVMSRSGEPWKIDRQGCRPSTPIARPPDELQHLGAETTSDWTKLTLRNGRTFDLTQASD
ncbi:MAG: hypothetical protein CL927_11765 [Deltaproteobacteria bacterium]|nr:hypothetical protein [Deltaproteobacteria bacterium]HCH66029.1 hypothetical protein [Deltaproteobacteria bacterium]